MLTVDVPRVRGKMAEKGYNTTTLAECLNISRNTLSGYLSAPERTPYAIIAKLADLLCDTKSEAESIFFASDLRET